MTTASEQMCRCGGPEFKHPNEPGPETCYLCVVLHSLDRAEAQIDDLRADLARVTEERDRLALVVDVLRQHVITGPDKDIDAKVEAAIARIRAEARAEALEEAAGAAHALPVVPKTYRDPLSAGEFKQMVLDAIRALANGKDGEW